MSQNQLMLDLIRAVDAEMSEDWECNSYHPSLRPALEKARAALSQSEVKPFSAPGAWFATDVLGNPMREHQPGKYEVAAWPSDQATQEVEAASWMLWLHGPVEVFMNRDQALLELERLSREYPVDTGCRKIRPLIYSDVTPLASQDWRDTLTANLLRQSDGLTKAQIRELIDAAVSDRSPDDALFTKENHMNQNLSKLIADFNLSFVSSNGVDVPARVSVSRDEWRALHQALQVGAPAFLGAIDRFDLNDEDGLLDWARDGAWVRFDAVESALAEVNKPELVKWQYRWLNPRKCQDASDEELAWKDVELTWPHKTLETKVKELEEYRLSGVVLYECRPLYVGPRPPSVDGPVEEKEN